MVSGKLTSLDMGRLEHVCAGALTSADPKLDIHLGAVTYADATARAILERLAARGVRLMHTVEPLPLTVFARRRRRASRHVRVAPK